ncbi:MAG: uracil-DNA glycosylase, partial [Gemmatimonadetes bacterium]|nr:uracil-DNA glycosylase [Gemmatimonadota bacterium]
MGWSSGSTVPPDDRGNGSARSAPPPAARARRVGAGSRQRGRKGFFLQGQRSFRRAGPSATALVRRPARDPDSCRGAAGATAPGATAVEIIQIGDLAALREVALGCPRCRLSETRTRVVFGEGSPAADIVVVGEAPGAEEDRTGRPFVGRAGKLLDLMLASIGFARESVFICNVLKCRPPGNRNPQADEVTACSPYL